MFGRRSLWRGAVPGRIGRYFSWLTAALPGVFLCLLSVAAPAVAHEEDTQLWLGVTDIGRLGQSDAGETSRWRYWLEAQVRFERDVERNFQNFVRPALGYDLTPTLTVWAGSAWLDTDTGAASRSEHRPWQQLTWFPAWKPAGFALQLRPRLEQRLLEDSSDTGWRFRQLVRGIRRLDGTPWSVVLQDELFINLNDTDFGADSGADQNRLFLGLAWHPSPAVRLEAGYLNQLVFRPGREDRMNHVVSVGLFLSH